MSSVDSRPPMQWSPEKRITTTFTVIGGLIAGVAIMTLGYAKITNSAERFDERTTALEHRQDNIENRISELRELAVRQSTQLDGVLAYSKYLVDGRSGPKPDVKAP